MATQTKIPPLTLSNPWWGHDPSDKQWLGLYAYEECPDLFYGGAAGPGKTSFLLMAAVQYVHYPHYRALILRKTLRRSQSAGCHHGQGNLMVGRCGGREVQ